VKDALLPANLVSPNVYATKPLCFRINRCRCQAFAIFGSVSALNSNPRLAKTTLLQRLFNINPARMSSNPKTLSEILAATAGVTRKLLHADEVIEHHSRNANFKLMH
jgi:hypothetical protein